MSEIAKPASPASLDKSLRAFTPARIALDRAGSSLATCETLAFALDHAQARDAVHASLSLPTLLRDLHSRGLPAVAVKSSAPDRKTYLKRPDLGRRLSDASTAALSSTALPTGLPSTLLPRLTIILADGLSALATDRHGLAVVDALLPLLRNTWEITELVVAEQARVALGDQIGTALGAKVTVMLIGERPGLSAADSLGAYITWEPRPGRTNAERNCISNIRGEGLSPSAAAERIAFFLREAMQIQATGTTLKDPDAAGPMLRD
jgi:ethanolamine ammonia-lyase small subunit